MSKMCKTHSMPLRRNSHSESKDNFDDRPEPSIRLEKARIARGFASKSDACRYHGWNLSAYTQHENGIRGIGRAAAKYARAFRVSEAWLLTGEGPAPKSAPLPVMGIAAGSLTGQNIIHSDPLEYVARPPALETVRDAYALWVRGSSMLPRFAEGDLVFVHPYRQPVAGDAIIIQQRINGELVAFIKELVNRSDKSLHCRQYNPPAEIDYPVEFIQAVHKVMSMKELFAR